MFPITDIDDETYGEIAEYLKNNIPVYSSEWTDHNEHDPGITFLELFSWLKEAQQFYMKQSVKRLEPQFLRLLGVEPRHAVPASAAVRLPCSENMSFYKGTPFYADKVCFVLDNDEKCRRASVSSVMSSDGISFDMRSGADLRIRIFGEAPRVGGSFTVGFTERLDGGRLRLYFSAAEYENAKRNPLAEGYKALADFSAQALADNVWVDISVLSDNTDAFTRSGYIELSTAENTEAVRFMLDRADYDVPPVIHAVEMNRFSVSQKEELVVSTASVDIRRTGKTEWSASLSLSFALENGGITWFCSDGDGYVQISEVRSEKTDSGLEVCFDTDIEVSFVVAVSVLTEKPATFDSEGLPFTEIDTELSDILYDDFELMVFDSARERWYPWKKTDLLRGAGTRREYSLDENSGKIRFGDGLRGMIPNGKIMIVSLTRTLAERGNIKDSRITRCRAGIIENGAEVIGASGGRPRETPSECLSRYRSSAVLKRAVTARDHEEIVRATPGLIVRNCLAAASESEENCVDIIAEPYSLTDRAEYNHVYEENILRYLLPKKLIGTKINLMFPTYTELDFYISVKTSVNKTRVEDRIREILISLFNGKHYRFGMTVPYNEIYAKVDIASEASSVEALDITVRDNAAVICENRNIILPKNGVAVIGRTEIKVTS